MANNFKQIENIEGCDTTWEGPGGFESAMENLKKQKQAEVEAIARRDAFNALTHEQRVVQLRAEGWPEFYIAIAAK